MVLSRIMSDMFRLTRAPPSSPHHAHHVPFMYAPAIAFISALLRKGIGTDSIRITSFSIHLAMCKSAWESYVPSAGISTVVPVSSGNH